MFKCELCGGEYETKEAAIKCIMKCARKAYDEGRFVPKEVPYREGETIVINELFTDPVSKKCRESALTRLVLQSLTTLQETLSSQLSFHSS